MKKVESYRCEACEGKGFIPVDLIGGGTHPHPCDNCHGTGVVWLTKQESKDNNQAKQ